MTQPDPLTSPQLDLDAIEARANAATRGPWKGELELASPVVYVVQEDGTLSPLWNAEWATEADGRFTAHAREDVPALVDEVRRLRAELAAPAYRATILREAAEAVAEMDTDPNTAYAARQLRLMADEASPAKEAAEACGKCRRAFDPADTRFDGHGRHQQTPYCRRCINRCRDTEIADHRCVICA
ncbi:hypothetical protein [Streptomyces sp. NPDC001781]